MLDLKTARFLKNLSQNDLKGETGVFQSKINLFEKSGINCIRNHEKEKGTLHSFHSNNLVRMGREISSISHAEYHGVKKALKAIIEYFLRDRRILARGKSLLYR